MFDENSFVANVWKKKVLRGEKKLEEVPDLYNLVDVVTKLVKGGE